MTGKTTKNGAGEPWSALPEALQELARSRWSAYREAAQEAGVRISTDAQFHACQCRVFAASDFVADQCTRYPEVLRELLDSGRLLADSRPGVLQQQVRAALQACEDQPALHQRLRQLRRREMLRIAWRDLAGWARLEETLGDLSELADACIQGALERLDHWQQQDSPVPRTLDRRPAALVVLAMGKLGAHELNFSSDIDLIFTYPDARAARKRDALSPEQYFTRLGQSLIQALSQADHDGFVFRVDMRLRPYGNAGALVCSFDAMEEYYQSQGREWERYAMIKARPVTGDEADRKEISELMRPFVYRRYLDFHAFDALRDLKRQIQREVERKGQADNLKLGPGGIREIEFIAQAFQLVRGGRDARLRRRGVIDILRTLPELKLLPAAAAAELVESYGFLRRAENRLQAMYDEQMHHLPDNDTDQARLALAMQYPDWAAFRADLERHRRRVEKHFQQVFEVPQAEAVDAPDPLADLWLQRLPEAQALKALEAAGFTDSAEALRWVEQLRSGTAPRYLGQQGRARFDALVPLMLGAVGQYGNAVDVLARLVSVLEHIAGRTTYLALLQENPLVLSQLVKLCAASPWIAQQIANFPLLLDQLLDPRALYEPLEHRQLQMELEQRLEGVDAEDLEQQMDRLRQFRHAMVLRVAAADVAGAIPVMVVSDRLTAIAEVVLQKTLELAWQQMVSRYGTPRCRINGKQRNVAFVIVGYGKLGGIELGYGSDLDLVFLHDSDGSAQHTSGRKGVDNAVFLTRLGQRVIHMLETFTAAGELYEVDMRLRPSGNSGLLVSSLDAFETYQMQDAWTWEHQALIRARVVAGDRRLAADFQRTRARVLQMSRDADKLHADVVEMRDRMRNELGSKSEPGFHLKQDPGGIVDIEFMVQYLVLRWCGEHPELLQWTDTIRLLETLSAAGLIGVSEAQSLIYAYQQYRALGHRLTLAEISTVVSDDMLKDVRETVVEAWRQVMLR